jgi:hypothetical protein
VTELNSQAVNADIQARTMEGVEVEAEDTERRAAAAIRDAG